MASAPSQVITRQSKKRKAIVEKEKKAIEPIKPIKPIKQINIEVKYDLFYDCEYAKQEEKANLIIYVIYGKINMSLIIYPLNSIDVEDWFKLGMGENICISIYDDENEIDGIQIDTNQDEIEFRVINNNVFIGCDLSIECHRTPEINKMFLNIYHDIVSKNIQLQQ